MIVRIRGVKRVRSKGRTYFYHRATKRRIMAPPNSAAFAAEVARLDETGGATPRGRDAPARSAYRAGSWGALVAAYRASPEFARLAPRTKRDYDRVLDYLAALDDMPLIQITPPAVLAIRDKAFTQRKRRFADYTVHMLSVVLGWGRKRGHVAENAAAGVEKIGGGKGANRPWSDEECAAVLEEARESLKTAIAIGMYAGMRIGDVVRLGWSAYTGDAIEWRQGKTGDLVWLPAHRDLRAILAETPRVATTIVAGAHGRPWTAATLRKEFRALVVRLLHDGRVLPGLTFHGLRSTAATRLADAGADIRAIQALLGHRTAAMALHYSRGADRRRAATAAVHLLERRE